MKTGQALLLAAVLVLAPAGAALAQSYGQGAMPADAQGATPAGPQVEITVPGAKSEQEARERLSADALLARCVIKPVMTDAEIDLCRRAYLLTRHANAGRRQAP